MGDTNQYSGGGMTRAIIPNLTASPLHSAILAAGNLLFTRTVEAAPPPFFVIGFAALIGGVILCGMALALKLKRRNWRGIIWRGVLFLGVAAATSGGIVAYNSGRQNEVTLTPKNFITEETLERSEGRRFIFTARGYYRDVSARIRILLRVTEKIPSRFPSFQIERRPGEDADTWEKLEVEYLPKTEDIADRRESSALNW